MRASLKLCAAVGTVRERGRDDYAAAALIENIAKEDLPLREIEVRELIREGNRNKQAVAF